MDAKSKSLQNMLPVRVTEKSGDAFVWYADGDLAAHVYSNLGAFPDPIAAIDVAQIIADALNARILE